MRLLWIVPLFALVLLGTTALGDVNNPEPGTLNCPGGASWDWSYDLDGGVPENATVVPGTCNTPDGKCYMVPSQACFQIGEVDSNVYNPKKPTPAADPVPPPPGPVPPRPLGPPLPGSILPSHPKGSVPLPLPDQDGCHVGTGWDFERFLDNTKNSLGLVTLRGYADFEGWTGAGAGGNYISPFVDYTAANTDFNVNIIAAPVYGNAVAIQRIQPPGWNPSIENDVGGDYWRFSQDINYNGNFWIGTKDIRYSWRQQPNEDRLAWPENAIGTLTSPPCTLRAPYLTFRLGGSYSPTQRVELHVKNGDVSKYYGIRFPNGIGDDSNGAVQFGLSTQWDEIPPLATQHFPPPMAGPSDDGWVTLRSAFPDSKDDGDWMQVNVWDVSQFIGQPIELRIVDDERMTCLVWGNEFCTSYASSHVNVDDFRFVAQPPAGTVWKPYSNGVCDNASGKGCSPIGTVPEKPPLWGVTDVHAHPMANVTFGGHVFWGDAADPLDKVYDCSSSAYKSSCYLSGEIIAVSSVVLLEGCSKLNLIPWIGSVAAAACMVAVSVAESVALSVPVISGAHIHGGAKMSSGAVKIGAMFSNALLPFLPDLTFEFDGGLAPTLDSVTKAKGYEGDGWWKKDEDYHSPTGLHRTHNMYQADMILRAYQGGMRLGVWDVTNSRAFALFADGVSTSDWQALKDGTDAAKRIIQSRLANVAEIAYTPDDAEKIVRAGKLAVILGSEVDELGRMRPDGLPWPRSPHSATDSMQKQVDDLWELGIRKITPVHSANNPIGGSALFTTIYDANNNFVSGTPLDGPPNWTEMPAGKLILDSSFGSLLAGLVLGNFEFVHKPVQPSAPPWNPQNWFDFDTFTSLLDPYIGPDAVTYRIGQDGAGGSLKQNGVWKAPQDVLGDQVHDIVQLKAAAFAFQPGSGCDLVDTPMPTNVTSFGDTVDKHYVQASGHRNALGLYHPGGDDGAAFIRAAMAKGMLIDLDHLSQLMRGDVYRLAHDYSNEAGFPFGDCTDANGLPCGDYPLVSVHSKVRGFEKDPSGLEEFRNDYGTNDEASRTETEIRRVAANHGTIAVYPTGSAFIPPSTTRCYKDSDCASYVGPGSGVCVGAGKSSGGHCTIDGRVGTNGVVGLRTYAIPWEVQNDCDESSKTYALKYLYMMRLMQGHGLTPAVDFNGINTTLAPRYGTAMPWSRACGGDNRANTDLARNLAAAGKPQWGAIMVDAQKYEFSGVWYDDYATRSPIPAPDVASWNDPRFKQVTARHSYEAREDRTPRAQVDDLVYYNDAGINVSFADLSKGPAFQSGNRPGAQMYVMKKWNVLANSSGWDFNLDGLKHIGLYPDLFQDMRNVGVQWEQMGPLFHSTRDYLETWRRAITIGSKHP